MICPWCRYQNREESLYCGNCSRTLLTDLPCTACGTANPSDNSFCDACGDRLQYSDPNKTPHTTMALTSDRKGYWYRASDLLRTFRNRKWMPKPGLIWETPPIVCPSSLREIQSWLIRNKLELAFVTMITGTAAFLRLYRITEIPAGLNGDEALTGLDALRIAAEGWIGPYVGSAMGQPAGPLYFTALIFKLSEPSLFTLRLSMSLLGIITVPAAYLLLRIGFGRWVAIFAVVVLSFSYWHLHYSRMAFMVVSMPLITTLSAASLLLALRSARVWPWALVGSLIGAGIYSYNGYVAFLPAIVAFLTITLILSRNKWRNYVPRFGILVITALVVALPMIRLVVFERDFYFQHFRQVSVLRDQAYINEATAIDKFRFLAGRIYTGAAILWSHEEVDFSDAMGGRGTMNPVLALLTYIGLAIAFARWRSPPYLLLALVVVCGLVVVVSGGKNLGELRRTLITVPFVYGLAGIAVVEAIRLAQRLQTTWGLKLALSIVGMIIAGVISWNTWHYFGIMMRQDYTEWVFASDLVDGLNAANSFDDPGRIYFYAGRWNYQYETVRFLYPDTPGIDRSMEWGEFSLERIDSGPVTYLMLPPYAKKIETLKGTLPDGVAIEKFSDDGSRTFSVYHLP